jgi:hypothetical protein
MTTTLTADQVVQLAYTVTAQPVKKVQNIVLPGSSQMIGGVSAVALDDAAASAIMSDASQDGVVAKKNVPPSPSRNQPVGG